MLSILKFALSSTKGLLSIGLTPQEISDLENLVRYDELVGYHMCHIEDSPLYPITKQQLQDIQFMRRMRFLACQRMFDIGYGPYARQRISKGVFKPHCLALETDDLWPKLEGNPRFPRLRRSCLQGHSRWSQRCSVSSLETQKATQVTTLWSKDLCYQLRIVAESLRTL